jgi:hypothetical protein
MTIVNKTTTYQGFALLLGAVSLIAVACGDDDAGEPGDNAGAAGDGGGSSAGKPSGGSAGKAGNSAGGNVNGGTSGGGNGGNAAAGSGVGGEGVGGEGVGGEGVGGEGVGGEGVGGEGVGGEAQGGAGGAVTGGGGEGGAGGAPEIVADTLDNGTFGTNATSLEGWENSGDTAAAFAKWHWIENVYDSAGLAHWREAAYKVTTSQLVSPLPNGTYSFSMVVQRPATLNEQYLFARGCTAGSPDAQVTKPTVDATADGFTKITLTGIQVTSGSCTFGIYTDAPDDGWANMDSAVLVLE